MKLSKERTGHIIVKAYTNSEWDSCQFAIIKISEDYLQELVLKQEAVSKLSGLPCFLSGRFLDFNCSYYTLGEISDVVDDFCDDDDDWSYIEITDEELSNLNAPEQKVDCCVAIIDKYGLISYAGNGKHTGEDFFTADIEIDKL